MVELGAGVDGTDDDALTARVEVLPHAVGLDGLQAPLDRGVVGSGIHGRDLGGLDRLRQLIDMVALEAAHLGPLGEVLGEFQRTPVT